MIQNIKTFPTDNLNDLIYLVKKYRAKHKLKLCLMLGVQSNSYEDMMSKISITTSNFMIVKKFYFPSMKRILLEVIYRLLKSEKNCYLFGTNFLKTIIENIQVYGLSLEKFKRIMHFLTAKHFYTNDFFFINALVEKDEVLESMNLKEMVDAEDGDEEQYRKIMKHLEEQNENLSNLDNCIKTCDRNDYEKIRYSEDELKKMLYNFYRKKLKFFKAYDLIEDLCIEFLAPDSKMSANIFRH